jgi:hypothetical protein
MYLEAAADFSRIVGEADRSSRLPSLYWDVTLGIDEPLFLKKQAAVCHFGKIMRYRKNLHD